MRKREMRVVFSLLCIAELAVFVRCSCEQTRTPIKIYKNGYGQNWLSGSRGTFLNDSSTLATTAGTTLVGLVKPFAQMSVTTTQPFCADSVLTMWIQGSAMQKAEVVFKSSKNRVTSAPVPLWLPSPDEVQLSAVINGVMRVQGPSKEGFFGVSINAHMVSVDDNGTSLTDSWDFVVLQDASGAGFSAYIKEAWVLPNIGTQSASNIDACIGDVCNPLLANAFPKDALVPVLGFEPVEKDAYSAADVNRPVTLISRILPGTTRTEMFKFCASLQAQNTSNPQDVFARSIEIQESRSGEISPDVIASCIVERDVVIEAASAPDEPVSWPLLTIKIFSPDNITTLRERSVSVVQYFEKNYVATIDIRDAFVHPDTAPLAETPSPNIPDIEALPYTPAVEGMASSSRYACSGVPWSLSRLDQSNLPVDSIYNPGMTGDGIHIFVLDTGLNPHMDFADKLGVGANCATDAKCVEAPGGSPLTRDSQGHGTHVAGIAAGERCFGVCKGCLLHGIKVLGDNGSGAYANIIAGIRWAIATSKANGWRSVINMSLGGPRSSTLDLAVQEAVTAGLVVVSAAGNDFASDACTQSPGSSDFSITVAATTREDKAASFSNVGPCVDIWAPGANIASADFQNYEGYKVLSGTSMAAPAVSGAAGLYLGLHPDATPDQVKQGLLNAAIHINLYPGTTTDFLQVKKSLYE